MNKLSIKEIIINVINSYQGIKAVKLSLKVMSEVNPHLFYTNEFFVALEELIRDNEIIELKYILPSMYYQVKSMYFPKGTKFKFKE